MSTYTRTPQIASRRQQNWGRNQNTAKFKSNIKLGPVAHTVLVALMIAVLGLIYLAQATKTSSFGQQANEVDSQITELSSRKSELEVQNARLTALKHVKDSSVASNMSTPSSVDYAE